MKNKTESTDPLARWVHWSLLAGVLISGLLLIVGLVLTLSRNEFRTESLHLHVSMFIRDALAGHGPALLNLGIIVLMLTPICRVLVLCIGWLLERQYRMALVALCVLVLLAVSLVIAVG
jgi:uncharacterized membrane protein